MSKLVSIKSIRGILLTYSSLGRHKSDYSCCQKQTRKPIDKAYHRPAKILPKKNRRHKKLPKCDYRPI